MCQSTTVWLNLPSLPKQPSIITEFTDQAQTGLCKATTADFSYDPPSLTSKHWPSNINYYSTTAEVEKGRLCRGRAPRFRGSALNLCEKWSYLSQTCRKWGPIPTCQLWSAIFGWKTRIPTGKGHLLREMARTGSQTFKQAIKSVSDTNL